MKSIRCFILLALILFGNSVFSQKLDPNIHLLIAIDSLLNQDTVQQDLQKSQINPENIYQKFKKQFHLKPEFKSPKSDLSAGNSEWIANVLVRTDGSIPNLPFGEIASVYPGNTYKIKIPVSKLKALNEIDGIISATLPQRMYPLNNNAITYTNPSVMQHAGYNGDSVICGIIDTGIDYTHPAFRNTDGSSRILYIWDQTDDSTSVAHPQPYNYGREYSKTIIDQDLASGNYHTYVNQRDLSGHGTMVVGSMAGRNHTISLPPENSLDGPAIHANLVVVKTTWTTDAILDGVDYIISKANELNLPVVIAVAYGTQDGPHDGSDIFTSTMANYTGPGRIIVQAAGNDGNDSIHVSTSLMPGTNQNFFFEVKSGRSGRYDIVGYYSGNTDLRLTLTEPSGNQFTQVSLGQTDFNIWAWFFGGILYVSNNTDASSGDNKISIILINPSTGTYTINLENLDPTNQSDIHFWIDNGGDNQVIFNPPTDPVNHGTAYSSTQYSYTLVSNACAQDLIVVGGYLSRTSWHTLGQPAGTNWIITDGGLGGIAPFSSHGPTRVGIQKPDVSASAGIILSTKSSDITLPDNYPWGPDETYTDYNYYFGTSFSAAIVAGGIAQLLEKYPSWTPDDVKTYFQNYSQPSTGDPNAGLKTNPGTWDNAFGYGVLDLTEEAWYYPKTTALPSSGTQTIKVGTKETAVVEVNFSDLDSFKVDLYTHVNPPFIPPGSPVLSRYYVVEPYPSYGTADVNLTFKYTDLEFQQAGFTSSNEGDLALYRYHNNAWIYVGGVVDTVNNTITAYNVSEFSVWVIGSMKESSLPVDVVSISSYKTEKGNVIQWSTRAEFDVAGYDIYRSESEKGNFALISTYRVNPDLRSKGNSNMGFEYSFIDQSADVEKEAWYKILAVDIDGSIEEFGPVKTSPFKLDLEQVNSTIPDEFKLHHPYPNPFNPTANIEFSLRKVPGQMFIPVRISVYNLLGQQVGILYEGKLPAGTYKKNWDASQLPAGMYIIHILTPYWQQSQKAMLVK